MTILSLSLDFFLKVPGRPGSFWSSLGLLRAESGTHFCRQDFFTTSDSPMELAGCFSVMVMADLAILAKMTMSTFNLMSFHLVTMLFITGEAQLPAQRMVRCVPGEVIC